MPDNELHINCLTYCENMHRMADYMVAKEDDAQVELKIIENAEWAQIFLTPDAARQLAVWLIHVAGKIEDRYPEMITKKETR